MKLAPEYQKATEVIFFVPLPKRRPVAQNLLTWPGDMCEETAGGVTAHVVTIRLPLAAMR